MIDTLINTIVWNEDDACRLMSSATQALNQLATNATTLGALLTALPDKPELCSLSERLGFMDKLVIWEDQDRDVRLRVHVFKPGYTDDPHDHRFDFATRILSGGYIHRIFPPEALRRTQLPQPTCIRNELPGDSYVMRHDAVHSVQATAETVTLVLRGPIIKHAATIRTHEGHRTNVVSSAHEPAAVHAGKKMNATELDEVVHTVRGALKASEEGMHRA